MALHIGIDGSCIIAQKAGIGFYVSRLLQSLDGLPGDERYTIFTNKSLPDLNLSDRFTIDLSPIRSSTLWVQTMLRHRLRRSPVDVFHSGSIGVPLGYRGKTIITVHDLAYLHYPAQKDIATRILWTFFVPRMIRQANHILTDSTFTKEDVVSHLNVPSSRITTIHLAADPVFRPVTDRDRLEEFRKENGLERDYILFVGTLEPRKNLPFLMRCFAECVRENKIDGDLVIAGKRGWLCEEIFRTAEGLEMGERIRLMGYVPDQEHLRLLYCGARFFVLPSLLEGFGLPPLEAMNCGVPVIASNRGSLPEVVGDAGLLLDATDEGAWKEAIVRWWNESDLSGWREKSLRRAAEFSWERCAKQTLEIYREVATKKE